MMPAGPSFVGPHNIIHQRHARQGKTSRVNPKSNNNVQNRSKKYFCPKCLVNYDVFFRNGFFMGRVPLVLQCHHTMCEDCIHKQSSTLQISCPTCKQESKISKKNFDNIQDVFPPNFHLVGLLLWSKTAVNKKQSLNLVPTAVSLKKKSSDVSLNTMDTREVCCFHECTKFAELHCNECSEYYCEECNIKMHKSAKLMWNHKCVPIGEEVPFELESCPLHNGMAKELFCNVCDMLTCVYCFLDKHEGHKKTELTVLTKEESETMQELEVKAKRVLLHLKATQQKLLSMMNGCTDTVEAKIRSCFTFLHSELYFIEKNLIESLDPNNTENGKFQELLGSVNVSIKNLEQQMSFVGLSEKKKVNVRLLLENLKKVALTPCHLMFLNNVDDLYNFKVDSALDNLENKFHLEQSSESTYSLVTYNEIPTQELINETDTLDTVSQTSAESIISAESDNSSEKSKHSKHSQARHSRPQTQNKAQGQNLEPIDIRHVENLYNFFVFRKSQNHYYRQFMEEIAHYVHYAPTMVKFPQINETYLSLFKTMWTRGRVISIGRRPDGEEIYEVYLIDRGQTIKVSRQELREIPPAMAQRAPFVIQCQLHDPTYSNWGPKAKSQFINIVRKKALFMRVVNKSSLRNYEVDVLVSAGSGNLTSVTDLLLNTCPNVLSSSDDSAVPEPQIKKELSTRQVNLFPNSVKIKLNNSLRVFISYVNSPDKIYFNEAANMEIIKKLQTDLESIYEDTSIIDYTPVKDTYAVIRHKHSSRGLWHRAQIKSVHESASLANVFLVDTGEELTLPFNNIMPLQEYFSALETQAIQAKLADIEPLNERAGWSNDAINYLDKYCVQEKALKITATCEDPLTVIIFEEKDSLDICLNASMVTEKLASSSGKGSLMAEWPQNMAKETEKLGLIGAMLKNIESDDEDNEVQGVPLQVEVLRIVDPGTIYIKFKFNQEKNDSLVKGLQIHYFEKQERVTKDTWLEGDKCVCRFNNIFSRAVIEEILPDKKYKIYLIDDGMEDVVDENHLFLIHPYFADQINMAYKAKLAEIYPAGDTGRWSTTATELLTQIFSENALIYVTKEGQTTDDKRIPVKMFYKHITLGQGLEPNYCKYVCINSLLVKIGLASRKALKIEKNREHDQNDFLQDKPEKLVSAIEERMSPKFKLNSDPSNDYVVKKLDQLDWIDPMPIKKQDFNAIITSVCEVTGFIYIREETINMVYQDMENSLKEYFDTKNPTRKESWEPNQICTVEYNNYWYRSKVLKMLDNGEVSILMIDFGSRHPLPLKDIYVEILFPDIPAFATKVKLHNVYPKCGKWLTSDHDLVMDLITEYGRIVVRQPREGDKYRDENVLEVDIYFSNGIHLNKELVKNSENLVTFEYLQSTTSDDEAIIIEGESSNIEISSSETSITNVDDNDEVLNSFIFLSLPILPNKIEMTIVNVLTFDSVILKFLNDNSYIEEYNVLFSDIQKSAEAQPELQEIDINQCCVCRYDDDLWYRAKIWSLEGYEFGYVSALYVDIGKVECVLCKDLKEIKQEWMKFPVHLYQATINIDCCYPERTTYVYNRLKRLIDKTKLIQVYSTSPLTVGIFEKNNSLCYQGLIDAGLLKLT